MRMNIKKWEEEEKRKKDEETDHILRLALRDEIRELNRELFYYNEHEDAGDRV